ncbi:MAG: hypothetical protein ABJC87_04770, partial [Roseobacter sp.]
FAKFTFVTYFGAGSGQCDSPRFKKHPRERLSVWLDLVFTSRKNVPRSTFILVLVSNGFFLLEVQS